MKHKTTLTIFLSSVLFVFAGPSDLQSTAKFQEAHEDDKVYSGGDVDKTAVIKNVKELDPSSLGPSFDCPKKGKVTILLVLRKTGKVTDIKVIKSMKCSFDEKAVRTAAKIKFSPAIKDDQPVSQHLMVEYGFKT